MKNRFSTKTPLEHIHKARFHLLMKYSFFGSLALGFKIVDASHLTDTMATDGKRFFYNSNFIEAQSTKDLVFVLMHEIGHVILLHHIRIPPRADMKLWNIAADFVVNSLLVDIHKLHILSSCLYDKKYLGMTTEQVYGLLKKELDWNNQTKKMQQQKDSKEESNKEENNKGNKNESKENTDSGNSQIEDNPSSGEDSGSSNKDKESDNRDGSGSEEGTSRGNNQSTVSNPEGHNKEYREDSNERDETGTGNGNKSNENNNPWGNVGNSEKQRQSEMSKKDHEQQQKIKDLIKESEKTGEILKATKPDKEEEKRVGSAMVSSYNLTKDRSRPGHNMPWGIKLKVEEMVSTKAPWQNILRDFFNKYSEEDYSYEQIDKRFAGDEVIMPSMTIKNSLDFVIAIDTSGSVLGADMLKYFISQTRMLLDDIVFDRLVIVYCSSYVTGYQEFSSMDELELEYTVGGGTRFEPVFTHVKDLNITPACLVYFTDLEAFKDRFGPPPSYPVLWAAYLTDDTAERFLGKDFCDIPFGTVLKLPDPETIKL